MQLFEDLGNRPLVLLRMNPDAYSDEHGARAGCFRTTEASGKLVLDDTREWERRVLALAERVQWHLENVPESEFSEEYLFFSVL